MYKPVGKASIDVQVFILNTRINGIRSFCLHLLTYTFIECKKNENSDEEINKGLSILMMKLTRD